MPFKSQRNFLSLNYCKTIPKILALFFSFALSVHADLSIRPVAPYSFYNNGNTIYYAGEDSTHSFDATAIIDANAGYNTFDLDVDSSSPDTSHLLLFDVVVGANDLPDVADDDLVASVFLKITGSTNKYRQVVPIATYSTDLNLCDTSNCKFYSDYYYGVKLTRGTTIRIGLYVGDICAKVKDASADCDSSGNIVWDATERADLHLTFAVGAWTYDATGIDLTNDNTHLKSDVGGSAEDGYILNFQNDSPTFSSCNANQFYFPGDGQIFVNPTAVIATKSDSSTPIDKLIVIGSSSGSPGTTVATYYSNEIFDRIDFDSSEHRVSGFTNDVSYEFTAALRDRSGAIGPFEASSVNISNCHYSSLKTSQILGLLSENRCFIASAVYQTNQGFAIETLRDFRDQFLEKFSLGQLFVKTYYKWSPHWAVWLFEHPQFRFSFLTLMTPLLFLSAMVLYPFLYLGIVFGLLSFIFLILKISRGRIFA